MTIQVIAQFPFFYSSCWFLLTSLLFPFTYLEPSFGMMRPCPPWSQVARKLTSPFSSHPLPIPNSRHPRSTVRFTKTTLGSRLLLVRNTHHVLYIVRYNEQGILFTNYVNYWVYRAGHLGHKLCILLGISSRTPWSQTMYIIGYIEHDTLVTNCVLQY